VECGRSWFVGADCIAERERDEARDEVERLRAEVERLRDEHVEYTKQMLRSFIAEWRAAKHDVDPQQREYLRREMERDVQAVERILTSLTPALANGSDK